MYLLGPGIRSYQSSRFLDNRANTRLYTTSGFGALGTEEEGVQCLLWGSEILLHQAAWIPLMIVVELPSEMLPFAPSTHIGSGVVEYLNNCLYEYLQARKQAPTLQYENHHRIRIGSCKNCISECITRWCKSHHRRDRH